MGIKNMKKYIEFITENVTAEKKFVIDKKNYKFKLFLDDILVSESSFRIEHPDKWFNEKYVTIHDLKTVENFQGKGYAKYLLEQIFNYVKNELKINIITLLVYKNNYKAVNLYLKCGFEVYQDYDDNKNQSFILIKKLKKLKI
jgi:ribosomal protein S18 acetylase RimI-like enzyme